VPSGAFPEGSLPPAGPRSPSIQEIDIVQDSFSFPQQGQAEYPDSLSFPPPAQAQWQESLSFPPQAQAQWQDSLSFPPQAQAQWQDSLSFPPQAQAQWQDSLSFPPQGQVERQESLSFPPADQVQAQRAAQRPVASAYDLGNLWGSSMMGSQTANQMPADRPNTNYDIGNLWGSSQTGSQAMVPNTMPSQMITLDTKFKIQVGTEFLMPTTSGTSMSIPHSDPQLQLGDDAASLGRKLGYGGDDGVLPSSSTVMSAGAPPSLNHLERTPEFVEMEPASTKYIGAV